MSISKNEKPVLSIRTGSTYALTAILGLGSSRKFSMRKTWTFSPYYPAPVEQASAAALITQVTAGETAANLAGVSMSANVAVHRPGMTSTGLHPWLPGGRTVPVRARISARVDIEDQKSRKFYDQEYFTMIGRFLSSTKHVRKCCVAAVESHAHSRGTAWIPQSLTSTLNLVMAS